MIMKLKAVLSLGLALAIFPSFSLLSAEKDAAVEKTDKGTPSGVEKELRDLIQKVQAKLQADKKTEEDLAEELKEFDAILAKHKDEKTDEVAQVLMMKALLYLKVFDNSEKGMALVQQVKKDFPDTEPGKGADKMLESLKKQEAGKKIAAALVEGAKFPDFQEKDLDGKPLSIANYKGKVVLIDFWATWCPPCVGELPNVIKTYEKHHKDGFEIIGISLDQSDAKLKSFIKDKHVTWQQYFDGEGWSNKLSTKYGVTSIPATYLLDGEGKILGKDLRAEELEKAVTKALAKKS
jgi:peroxiredoxin